MRGLAEAVRVTVEAVRVLLEAMSVIINLWQISQFLDFGKIFLVLDSNL